MFNVFIFCVFLTIVTCFDKQKVTKGYLFRYNLGLKLGFSPPYKSVIVITSNVGA